MSKIQDYINAKKEKETRVAKYIEERDSAGKLRQPSEGESFEEYIQRRKREEDAINAKRAEMGVEKTREVDKPEVETVATSYSRGEAQRGSRVGDTAVQVIPGKTVSEANKQVNATVRSAADIAKDLRAVDGQIEKLNVNTTRNTSWVPANVQTEEQKQRLDSLKATRERLQQEYNAATKLPTVGEVTVPRNYTRNMPVTVPEGVRRAEYWASIPDYTDLTANLSELETKKQELTDSLNRSTRELRMERQTLLSQKGNSSKKQNRLAEIEAKLKEAEEKSGISALEQQIAEAQDLLPASYAKLQRSADFEENGVFDEGFAKLTKDDMYNLVNKPDAENNLLRNTYTQGDVKSSEGAQAFSDIVTGTVFNDPTFIRNMTDDERKTYNYIYKKSGKEAADKYLATIESGLTARYRTQIEEQAKKFANEHPVAASALTVAASPLKAVGYVGQTADYAVSGKIDQNSPRNAAAYASTAVREEVAENIDESITRKVGEVWGDVGSNAYQIGMSMADFAFNTLASGGTAPLASFIMGSSAAADTTIRAKDRGLKDNQAFALGFISGATELLTEKYSIDTLLEKSGMGKKAFTYWLKNVIGEGSEETTSEFVNIVADIMIAGDKSEWNQSIETYKKNGMSEQDAFWATFADNAISLGVSFIGGAVSGGTLAALKLGGDVIDRKVTHSGGQVHREIYDADTANKTEKLSAVNDALEAAKSARIDDPAEMTETSAEFVRTVRDARPDTKNAINTAIDYVREEISVYNDLIKNTKDSKQKGEYVVERAALINVDKTLRSNRAEVDALLANLPAQSNAEMQTPAQTEPKAQVQTEAAAETASAPETTKPRQTVTKSVLKDYGIDTEVPASKFPEYLLNQLQTGKITQEEADALDAEYEAKYPKKAAETKLNAATAAYQKGEISEEQYDAQYSQYETELKDIDSRMSSETFPVRLRPVYEEVVQPVSEAETQTEQTVDDSTNAADTTSVNAGEGSAPVRENVADIAGDEAQTAEEVAERLAEEGYSFRDIRNQINAYRAENTAESNAEAARLEEADRILVKKNRANVQKVANAYAPILKRFGINGVVVEDMPVGRNAAFDRKTNTIHLSSRISDSGAVGRFIVHEFTHRGTKIDMSLADSIVSAMESRKGGRGYISEAVIRNAYADQLSGLSAEEADSIVREERAAHFMERIMEDVNVLDEFRDDRTFLRKILDAIRDFFARNNPDKQEQIRLRNIEKKINDLLKAANVDEQVKAAGGVTRQADKPNQIKSATDNIGTFDPYNPDIRYSRDIESPEQKHIRRLEEQNEYLKKQYQSWTAFGWAKTVSPAQRKQFAGTIAADIPGVSADEVSAAIKPVYDLFEKPKRGAKDTPEVRLAEARKLAQEAAERLVDGAIETEINPMYEQYNDLRNFLRTTPIKRTISAEEFGGAEAYSKWRDGNRGLLRVSTNPDARGIDSVYKEISAQYPEFFPKDITDMAEMLRRMGDVAVLLKTEAGNKTVKVNPLEDVRDSFVQDVANRILYGFDQLAKITPAAKYEYGGKVNERDVQRAYAEGMSSAAAREAQAYDSGLKEGRKQNDLEVQAAHQREDIQYQIFQRDFNQAVNNFNREIERQNKRIETLQKRIETRGQREQLAMAKKVVYGRLNRLNTMLTKPNRSKHIPQNLRAPVARLLEAVGTTYLPNGKTVQSGAMQDIQEKEYARFESESVRVVDEIATIIGANKTSENNAVSQQYLDKLTENVLRLKEMHAEMNPNSSDDVVLPPDLMSTKKIEYVKQLNRILAMAENYIKDSNTVFLAGKATSAKDFSERMISDLRGKTVPNESNRLRKFFHDVGYEFVSADLFFEMVGESGNDIMRQYRKAQTTQAKCEEEYAQYIFGKTEGKYSTNKAGFSGDLIDISANGKKLKVTRAQLMQLYMTWKRPAGRRHLRTGGAIFVNEAGVELKENTILINNATYDELISHLSDEDKRIADALGSFMVRRCAEWGNDASMQMYGYRMFEDPHYFPMDVSNNVLPANWDSMDEFYRLENAGMTKSIKENASAPLRMTDIFDVADFHVRTMAAYAAYAPVSNDMQRILNMPGVNEAVNVGMGKKGAKYLETLVKTIASNKVRTGDMSDAARPLQFFMNAYKRQAVSFNISTALKQPLSIVRALNDIDAKYILKAPASMMSKEYARAYNAMIENSGVAKMKMLGYSDTGFGKSLRQIYDTGYINESGIVRGSAAGTKAGRIAVKTYDKITDAGMWAAGKMDEATWVRLWRACELEVSDRHKGLSAKEKTAKVAERFNEIIGRSQVVDTVLDTSPLMRNNAMAILTPFMNEPTKALATIITAADAYRDGKAGSKKKLVKAIGLVALNNLLLEPIVSALMTMWRDEEDDTENIVDFSKKFLKLYAGVDLDGDTSVASVMTSNAVSGVFGFPILQIFYNTFSDSMQNYSNEKIDTAALSNLIRDTKNLIVNSRKEAVDRVETNYKLFSDFLGSASAAIGIPLPTLRRQASAMVRTALEHTDSYDLQWRYAKILYNLENSFARTQKQFYNILAAAYKANDVADYQYMLNDLKNTQTGKNTIGISWNKMKKYIEDRGGKYEIGSDLWLVGVQAEFNLSSFNPAMKVETMLGKIYKSAISEGVKNPERALPSTPALYSYNKVDENGNDVLDENGDPVKVEMTLAEYEDFIADVGKLSYNILLALQGQGQFKNLSAEEQVYCLDKAYDFAARYYRSKFNPDYDLSNGGKWMAEVAKGNLDTTKISRAILNAERNRK